MTYNLTDEMLEQEACERFYVEITEHQQWQEELLIDPDFDEWLTDLQNDNRTYEMENRHEPG